MSSNRRIITYATPIRSQDDEKSIGLYISVERGKGMFLNQRVESENGSIVKPFALPWEASELRKIAQAINELADYTEKVR
ncbi:hypothetical protein MUN35_10730 [Hafnia paralvei]|uniref:hypothetical protein n=1 Tax=Hafnia paralvei TaxID=546367 RepID=UPI001FFEBB4D|nr:hypothetical protein [Hafnia paralvei]MCK2180175.1 hypothetical protein [Hafnia paralvei]